MASKHQNVRPRERLSPLPVRAWIVDAMRSCGRPISPSRLAKNLGRSVGSITYHIRLLEDAGVVVFVDEGRARGAAEYFYALAADEVEIGDSLVELQKICNALTLQWDDGDPRAVELDEKAREELHTLLVAVRPKVLRVVRSAAKRAAGRSQGVVAP